VREQEGAAKGAKGWKPTYSYDESCQWISLYCEAEARYVKVYKRLMLRFNGKEITY
jgi:hypothetical protein